MLTSLIRTYVPILVSVIVGWLTTLGVSVSDEQQAALSTLIGGVAGAVYYAGARWLEQWLPWASWLLGSSQTPTYSEQQTMTPWSDADLAAIGAEPVEGGRLEADE